MEAIRSSEISWLTTDYTALYPSQSQSYIATDCRSISKFEPHLGHMTRYLLLFDSYGLVFVGHPLWREDGSVFCICYWPSPAQSFSPSSPLGLTTKFYCLSSESSNFIASYDSQGHGGDIRPRSLNFKSSVCTSQRTHCLSSKKIICYHCLQKQSLFILRVIWKAGNFYVGKFEVLHINEGDTYSNILNSGNGFYRSVQKCCLLVCCLETYKLKT
jgi:hypothetical protein